MKKKSNKAKASNAVKYYTRNQAIRKLQLRLTQFRRLCILKGVHPRDPKKKPKGPGKTYFHAKDILFLAHEPLLKKFREISAHEKKVHRARAKLNNDLAKRLLTRKPTYRLDHLVKERYPSFVDALRDLDDALTLIHLFATLPAEQKREIPKSAAQVSRRLALEWQAYIVRTHSLRKVFVAVKGFYYQAEVLGQTVTWLVPHQLSQVLPEDVDFRIMTTFLEFYQTLLQFVNFKLYHTIGVSYPPVVDPRLEEAAAGLSALMEDLAGQQPALPSAAGVDKPMDAAAAGRLEGLQDKLRVLQEESAAEAAAERPDQAGLTVSAPEYREDSEEEGSPEIDSGSESSDAEGEAKASKTSGERLQESDLGTSKPDEEAGAIVASSTASAYVGGATEGDDDADVCSSLFRGLVFYLGREVPREQLLVVIRAFGGKVGWEGEGSPFDETDQSITHQVFDRPELKRKLPDREYVQPQWVVDSANFRVLVDARLYGPGASPPPHLSPFVDNEDEGYVPEYAGVLQKMQESARALRRQALGLATETEFLKEDEALTAGEPGADDLAAAEKLYAAELSKELGEKRKAEEEAEEALEDDGDGKAGEANEVGVDEETMNKALMTRKDRNLYQSILNRQKAQAKKVRTLKQKRARLSKEEDAA